MRSSFPEPHNPWPHDMAISVDDVPHQFLELLYVRHAWGVGVAADIPDLDPLPEVGTSWLPDSASAAEWDERWFIAWERAWGMLADPRAAGAWIPWRADHGSEGIDSDAYTRWERKLGAASQPGHRKAQDSPMYLNLPALIAAWKGGLNTFTVLPYAGYFARRVSPNRLVVSRATYDDAADFGRALATRFRLGGLG